MKHIFWLEHHPRSISGLIEFLAKKDHVFCVCYNNDIFGNRSSMGWTNDKLSNVEFIYLNQLDSATDFLDVFCEKHKSAINYIMGVRASNISHYVNRYVLAYRHKKVFMLAERPYFYGKGIIASLLLKVLYWWYGFKLRNKITGVFAMGKMGAASYKSWAHGNVFPFLYPRFNSIQVVEGITVSTPLRALYVGQLDYRKGIDTLINVIRDMPSSIQLDVVGANGNLEKIIKHEIDSIENVNYLGVWTSDEVAKNSASYDLCIVPSRYDGWGMYVMEAIEAGVGVITTDQTGSKDLVYASGAGKVVKAGSEINLKSELMNICSNPSILKSWKMNARAYKNRISQDVVGKYFRDIVLAENSIEMKNVKCPWL